MEINQLASQYGLVRASQIPYKRISTGFVKLDTFLLGGYERKKITEITGFEQTGKTHLCIRAAKNVQSEGGIVAVVDTENFAVWAKKYSLCPEKTIFCPLHVCHKLLHTKTIDLLLIDNIASVSYEENYSAKSYYKNLRKVADYIAEIAELIKLANTACIITNQFRNNLKNFYPYGDKHFGKFFDTRIFLKRIANKTFLGDGFRVNVLLKKNSAEKIFEGKELEISIDLSAMNVTEIIQQGLTNGVIRFDGKNFVFLNEILGRTKQDIANTLAQREDLLSEIASCKPNYY
ncbi:hypothetical protein [Raineya sp.]